MIRVFEFLLLVILIWLAALGFPNWLTARQWYKRVHGLPFDGVLIHFPESK